jgi:endonuclease YncB( thermonuclease family)
MNKKQYRTVSTLVGLTVALYSLGHELSRARPALHEARVIEVNDGDRVTIRPDSRTCRTRLVGIDAPEMGQWPWGRRAKEHLIGIMRDSVRMVFIETDIVKHDKYGRLFAYLWQNRISLTMNGWFVTAMQCYSPFPRT